MSKTNIKMPTAVQLPSGNWRCQVLVDGKRYSFVNEDPEEAVRLAMIRKLQRSVDIDIQREANSMLTVGEAIDRYVADRKNILSPSTIKSYKSMRKYRFQSVMDKKLSDKINWQSVINAEAKEVKAKTVKNAWILISSVLKENNLYVTSIRLPQIVSNEHEFLQPDEIKTLVSAIKGHRFETAYLLGLHSLRRSEVCAVKKSDIKNGYIFVSGAKVYNEDGMLIERKENKTIKSKRKVPVMIPRLTELVDQCETEYLCPYNPSSLSHPLNTICRQNDLPEVGMHGLRHSFASLCYHLGISELQCMEFGGWGNILVMRKIYTHLASSDRKDAETKLKSFFEK